MPSPSTKNSFKAGLLEEAGRSRSLTGSRGSLRRSSYRSRSLSRSLPAPRSRCAILGYGINVQRASPVDSPMWQKIQKRINTANVDGRKAPDGQGDLLLVMVSF